MLISCDGLHELCRTAVVQRPARDIRQPHRERLEIEWTMLFTPRLCQERELVEHADHASVGGFVDFALSHVLHFGRNLRVAPAV